MKKSRLFTILFALIIVVVIAIPLFLSTKKSANNTTNNRVEDVEVITEFTLDMVGKAYKTGTKIEDTTKIIKYVASEENEFYIYLKDHSIELLVFASDYNYISSFDDSIQNKSISSDDEDVVAYLGTFNMKDNYNYLQEQASGTMLYVIPEDDYAGINNYVGWRILSITEDYVTVEPIAWNGYFPSDATNQELEYNGIIKKGQLIVYGLIKECKTLKVEYKNRSGEILESKTIDPHTGMDLEPYPFGLEYDVESWNVWCPFWRGYYHLGEGMRDCQCILTEGGQISVTLVNDATKGEAGLTTGDGVDLVANPTLDGGGDTVIIHVKPKNGYKESIVVTDDSGNTIELNHTNDEYTFIMPDKDVTVTVTYTEIDNDVTPDPSISPSVEPSSSSEEGTTDGVPDTAEVKTGMIQKVGFVVVLIAVVYVGMFFRKKYFRKRYR